MAHSPEDNPVSPEALQLGYQPESVRFRRLAWLFICFVVTMAALHALVWFVMKSMNAQNASEDAPRSELRLDQQRPPPNLQPSVGHATLDSQDLESLRQSEDAIFKKLGWDVNPNTHEVKIPTDIEQRVAAEAHHRAAAPFVPPTTTGKNSNSILPTTTPTYDIHPGVKGGQRP